jgi:UDP-N-acetylglucosamine 2-epimerase (non-hydrolysing)
MASLKTVVSVVGIRPDFIRMSAIFRRFDKEFRHIVIHTGQHYQELLSDVFFKGLGIRDPDYNLGLGGPGKPHYKFSSELSTSLIELIQREEIHPDLIVFLGDSNSVLASVALKKEGYKIAHIEAGMRSGDRRMLEEINRTVCDHCSDHHFVYHPDYATNLATENISQSVYIVGNTIVEVCKPLISDLLSTSKTFGYVLADIHRPENFKDGKRLSNILEFLESVGLVCNSQVLLLQFPRLVDEISKHGLKLRGVEWAPMMPYKEYLTAQYQAPFIISDSGTAQEESALLNTPVLVPRDFTERPQSMKHGCSRLVNIDDRTTWMNSLKWAFFQRGRKLDSTWLGNGDTSRLVTEIIKGL